MNDRDPRLIRTTTYDGAPVCVFVHDVVGPLGGYEVTYGGRFTQFFEEWPNDVRPPETWPEGIRRPEQAWLLGSVAAPQVDASPPPTSPPARMTVDDIAGIHPDGSAVLTNGRRISAAQLKAILQEA